MNRGFLIIAQNNSTTNYVNCAIALAHSIKKNMPNESVTLVTTNGVDIKHKKYFDNIVTLPYGDLAPDSDWKLINDWQSYEASPYEYTIKLEADLFLPRSIEYWWEVLTLREIVVSTTIRNFRQEISEVRAYRKFIDDNDLPDCYNAITYFKKSHLAKQFFELCRDIFDNWDRFKSILKCNEKEIATTDWVYALACHILGEENTTLPCFTDMSMVHMKQFINELPSENWTDTFIYEILPHTLRVNTCPQMYPFHYHVKNFADKLIENNYG